MTAGGRVRITIAVIVVVCSTLASFSILCCFSGVRGLDKCLGRGVFGILGVFGVFGVFTAATKVAVDGVGAAFDALGFRA